MFQKNIPILIKILAGFHYLGAFFSIAPLVLFFVSSSLYKNSAQMPLLLMFIITCVGISIQILIARALLRGKKWVQSLYIFIGIMGTFAGVISLLFLKLYGIERILGLLLSILFLYYFIFSKEAKDFFNTVPIPIPPEVKV